MSDKPEKELKGKARRVTSMGRPTTNQGRVSKPKSTVPAGTPIYTLTDLTDDKIDALAEKAINRVVGRIGGKGGDYVQQIDAKREDIKRVVCESMQWFGRRIVTSDDECEDRIRSFFARVMETGEIPTMEKLALALGTTRTQLHRWEVQKICGERRSMLIQMAREMMASVDAGLVLTGDTPTVPYIFRAKNYYGLSDETKVVVSPENPLETRSVEEIRQKYLNAAGIEEENNGND